MKNIIAAAVLLLHAVSSAGVVLVEYTCHETGTSGMTTSGPRACYAPTCGDEEPDGGVATREADAGCDYACCDVNVRVSAPGDQVAGTKPAPNTAGDPAVVSGTAPVAFDRAPTADAERPPAAPFPGFDRPLRN